MRRYPHALIGLLLVAATPAAALQEDAPQPPPPAPTCHLVRDPAGDTTPVDSPALDIVSADVASSSRQVVTAVRVRSLVASDPLAQTGARWEFSFRHETDRYTFVARRDARGMTTGVVVRETGGLTFVVGPAIVRFDFNRSEVVIAAVRGLVIGLPAVTGTAKFGALAAATYAGPVEIRTDVAASANSYLDGTKSCVVA